MIECYSKLIETVALLVIPKPARSKAKELAVYLEDEYAISTSSQDLMAIDGIYACPSTTAPDVQPPYRVCCPA